MDSMPMASPSFKSSVGSKSTSFHLRRNTTDGDILVDDHQERRHALRSFWISRLHLPPLDCPLPIGAPTPQRSSRMLRERVASKSAGGYGAGARERGAISTEESRRATTTANPGRHLNVIEDTRQGAARPPPRIGYEEVGEARRQAVGFGPFQVRATDAIRSEEETGQRMPGFGPSQMGEGADGQWRPNFRFSHGRKLESVDEAQKIDQPNASHRKNEVSLSLFFRPPADVFYSRDREKGAFFRQMDEGGTKQFQNWTHRWTTGNDKGPSPSVGEALRPQSADERQTSFGLRHANASAQAGDITRAAAAHCDVGHGEAPSASFCGYRFRHENLRKRRLGHDQDKKNQSNEQFSFWNFGKFNKGNVISSPTTVSWNLNRKRTSNTQSFVQLSKFRKM